MGQMKIPARIILALAIYLPLQSPSAVAADHVVWEIGKFDQSPSGFNGKVNFADPNYNPVFKVGQSDPAKDWPSAQPGSENQAGGSRPHPYTIIFKLAGAPQGVYRLTISVLLKYSRVPHLGIEINGQSGLFYFHRKVSYYPGDFGVDSPTYGGDQLEIALPTAALRAGENKLVLTAMDDPGDGPAESIVTYDALSLTQSPGGKAAGEPQGEAEPTMFYVQQADGPHELTFVTATLEEKVRKGKVALVVGGEKFEADLSTVPGFGQQRFEFAIPELSGKTPATLTLQVNGKTRKTEVTLEPKRKWTVYVVPHIHLDIGFTDYQPKVAEVHNRNLDKLQQVIRDSPEMRFSIDGSWIAQKYLGTRNAAAREGFLHLAREGKIGVPAQLANVLTGYPTLEELIRSADYSYRLHQEMSLPFGYADITDIPSYTWSYPSVLHALGIKYFAAAANSDRAPILLYGRWNQKSPFWWQGPDGSKVLMAYTRQYLQFAFACGTPASEAACRDSLPTILEPLTSSNYQPDAALLFGTQSENRDLVPGLPEFVRKWNAHYAYPKMILSTFPDYFRYIDQHYGSVLETVVGDFGPYWEDGLGTDSRYVAIDRSSQQRAPSAEKLATLAAYLQKDVAGPKESLRQMWEDFVLYAEHTFTSWGGYSRPESEETVRQLATKDQFAVDGRERINAIVDGALSQMADQIHIPPVAIVVFNSLNWTRDGLVETDLDAHSAISEYPGMNPVPVEVLHHYQDYDRVRFLARDVPSLGYKCYQIAPSREPAPPGETVLPFSNTVENDFYRVELDPAAGAVRSVFDKQLHRELVDASSAYRLNQYLYVSGGDETATQLVYLRKSLPLAQLTVGTSTGGRVTSVRKTPFGQILTYQTSGPHAPTISTDIILFDREKKIEFINRVQKEPVENKEAVYFAFPLAIANPRFSYEIQNGWVDPSRDVLKGGSLEWSTVQHWVREEGADVAVGLTPIDAPLVTLGDINRGTWPEKFIPKSSVIFSWVMNDYWHTDFRRVQSGGYTFRYMLTSGRELSSESLARMGRAAMTPLESQQVLKTDKLGDPERPLSPAPTSFLQVDAPNVVVENWKSAEDGHGSIIRLVEVGGTSADAHLNFPLFDVQQAWRANAVEENQEELPVSAHSLELKMRPHEILTVRVAATFANHATGGAAK
ncbi:MAG: polysaccharide lyase family protein [Terriglobia bacterium]|jgi:hypothetical protein